MLKKQLRLGGDNLMLDIIRDTNLTPATQNRIRMIYSDPESLLPCYLIQNKCIEDTAIWEVKSNIARLIGPIIAFTAAYMFSPSPTPDIETR